MSPAAFVAGLVRLSIPSKIPARSSQCPEESNLPSRRQQQDPSADERRVQAATTNRAALVEDASLLSAVVDSITPGRPINTTVDKDASSGNVRTNTILTDMHDTSVEVYMPIDPPLGKVDTLPSSLTHRSLVSAATSVLSMPHFSASTSSYTLGERPPKVYAAVPSTTPPEKPQSPPRPHHPPHPTTLAASSPSSGQPLPGFPSDSTPNYNNTHCRQGNNHVNAAEGGESAPHNVSIPHECTTSSAIRSLLRKKHQIHNNGCRPLTTAVWGSISPSLAQCMRIDHSNVTGYHEGHTPAGGSIFSDSSAPMSIVDYGSLVQSANTRSTMKSSMESEDVRRTLARGMALGYGCVATSAGGDCLPSPPHDVMEEASRAADERVPMQSSPFLNSPLHLSRPTAMPTHNSADHTNFSSAKTPNRQEQDTPTASTIMANRQATELLSPEHIPRRSFIAAADKEATEDSFSTFPGSPSRCQARTMQDSAASSGLSVGDRHLPEGGTPMMWAPQTQALEVPAKHCDSSSPLRAESLWPASFLESISSPEAVQHAIHGSSLDSLSESPSGTEEQQIWKLLHLFFATRQHPNPAESPRSPPPLYALESSWGLPSNPANSLKRASAASDSTETCSTAAAFVGGYGGPPSSVVEGTSNRNHPGSHVGVPGGLSSFRCSYRGCQSSALSGNSASFFSQEPSNSGGRSAAWAGGTVHTFTTDNTCQHSMLVSVHVTASEPATGGDGHDSDREVRGRTDGPGQSTNEGMHLVTLLRTIQQDGEDSGSGTGSGSSLTSEQAGSNNSCTGMPPVAPPTTSGVGSNSSCGVGGVLDRGVHVDCLSRAGLGQLMQRQLQAPFSQLAGQAAQHPQPTAHNSSRDSTAFSGIPSDSAAQSIRTIHLLTDTSTAANSRGPDPQPQQTGSRPRASYERILLGSQTDTNAPGIVSSPGTVPRFIRPVDVDALLDAAGARMRRISVPIVRMLGASSTTLSRDLSTFYNSSTTTNSLTSFGGDRSEE